MADKTREIQIGNRKIGGGHPVLIQSMTTARTQDRDATLRQILELEAAGCEIVRFAVPDEAAAENVSYLKEHTHVPLVADIHFDYRLALICAERGIDKIRINPGNIGGADRVEKVAKACKSAGIPIRIGVNLGSLEKGMLEACGGDAARAMVESAARQIEQLLAFDFENIVLSMKASDVPTTIRAYRLASERFDFPLHLGVTEAGTPYAGLIKSAMGIGALLCDGIGDTIRVSLTANPVEEVKAAREILKAAGLRGGVTVVSCPTCGRCRIPLIEIAQQVERALESVDRDLKVAVMGCAVNGPGEARDADIGIAGGDGAALLFKKGTIVRKIPQEAVVSALLEEIEWL